MVKPISLSREKISVFPNKQLVSSKYFSDISYARKINTGWLIQSIKLKVTVFVAISY
jgi:hypothetical protein